MYEIGSNYGYIRKKIPFIPKGIKAGYGNQENTMNIENSN